MGHFLAGLEISPKIVPTWALHTQTIVFFFFSYTFIQTGTVLHLVVLGHVYHLNNFCAPLYTYKPFFLTLHFTLFYLSFAYSTHLNSYINFIEKWNDPKWTLNFIVAVFALTTLICVFLFQPLWLFNLYKMH